VCSSDLNPSVEIAEAKQVGEARTGTTETIVTEAGYHNATNTTSGHNPVNENVSATYLPRMLAEHVLAGTKRLYTYELLDGSTDTGRRDLEAHFGLLRTDFTPKPAYTAMKNMLAVLDDTEERFTPGSLSYDVRGGGSELRQLLTQRSDGTYVLLLWRDVSVWSNGSRSEIAVATTPVQVSVPPQARLAIPEPNQSSPPTTDGVRPAGEGPPGGQPAPLPPPPRPRPRGPTPSRGRTWGLCRQQPRQRCPRPPCWSCPPAAPSAPAT